ncbi:MAG TPA: hypothetical protein VJ021_09770 [Thermoplasmata archaeon]|nr:hypothetical protein [Thermoplasmata archaeon]
MAQRSLVTFLAAFGGILVMIGGILGFLLIFDPYGYGPRFGMANIVVLAALAVIAGLVILVYSGVTHLQGAERNLTGGVILMVLGIVTWAIAGAWLLVAIGSFLTVMAGLIILLLAILHDSHIQVQTA